MIHGLVCEEFDSDGQLLRRGFGEPQRENLVLVLEPRVQFGHGEHEFVRAEVVAIRRPLTVITVIPGID